MAVFVRMVVRVGVRVFVPSIERGHGHHQAAVLYAFEADENVGEVLDPGGISVDDQHFKAGIVIEMRVTRRDHQVVVLVLHLGQLLSDSRGVVVKDEGHGADDGRVRRGGLLADQPVADQIPECFRSVRVSTVLNRAVELFEKIGIESNADSA